MRVNAEENPRRRGEGSAPPCKLSLRDRRHAREIEGTGKSVRFSIRRVVRAIENMR
jgi:hypothetical protein